MILLSLCGQAMECGGLNILVLHNLTGSNTISKCGFVVVGMALCKETSHYGGGRRGFLCSGYGPVSQMASYSLHDI